MFFPQKGSDPSRQQIIYKLFSSRSLQTQKKFRHNIHSISIVFSRSQGNFISVAPTLIAKKSNDYTNELKAKLRKSHNGPLSIRIPMQRSKKIPVFQSFKLNWIKLKETLVVSALALFKFAYFLSISYKFLLFQISSSSLFAIKYAKVRTGS